METKNQTCTSSAPSECSGCDLGGKLKCQFNKTDLLKFIGTYLVFAIPSIIGVILAGYGWFLLGWLIFYLIFFEVWEIRILCSHCPYYAEDDKTLHCIANYGIRKLWKYHPEPLSISEKVQLIIGFVIFGGYPIIFIALGAQLFWLILSLIGLGFFFIRLNLTTCNKCVNFSCPLNRVKKIIKDEYLKKNPVMREAWEKTGYKIE